MTEISGEVGGMFLFFSSRLGCLGSLIVTLILSGIVYLIISR